MLIAALGIIITVLILVIIFSVSDNLIQIEAKKEGIDTTKNNFSMIPSLRDLFGTPAPSNVEPGKFHSLKQGHDIKLVGAPVGVKAGNAKRFAMKPTDFRGIAPIPKVVVEVGDEVKAGQTLFFDKPNPDIKYAAPVSGEIVEVRRGAKRAISHVVILADKEQKYHQHNPPSANADRNELVSFLQASGAWPLINQRPFDIVADPTVIPANVFISTFDTAPLAVDLNKAIEGKEEAFQKGCDVLNQLTSGSVILGMDGRKGHSSAPAFMNAHHVEKHWFSGKHPVGNVGVQIHHTQPIKNNSAVWTLKPEDVATIGQLFINGEYDASRLIALSGGQFVEPHMVHTHIGASIDELTKGNIVEEGQTRLISGNVLTGTTVGEDDFVSVRDNTLTSIKEGDDYELFGWLLPIAPRPSVSGTFPNFLIPNHQFEGNTNTHGEKRAFVVTGQYEKMLPMDILPQHLMKAIMTGDIERMEGLGINELSEEDIALCEFACTSKMPLQEILRDGLDMMREQG